MFGLSLLAVAFLMVIGSVAGLLLAPATIVTTLPFRLEFKGAERGQYPNGTRFSTNEILSTPVLLSVYRANELEDTLSFQAFKSSLFILESNAELEKLSREYSARLADPDLAAVDRERLEKEFIDKKESLAQGDHSINFVKRERMRRMPKNLQIKILQDILTTWAEQTIQNKGVVLYDLSILSSEVFEKKAIDTYDYVIALDMLRSKIQRVIRNIDDLLAIPGSKVARTAAPKSVSLAELRVRLDDSLDFKIQPLVGMILSRGLSKDPASSIQFLETRLTFNELEREEAQSRAETLQRALLIYLQETRGSRDPQRDSGKASEVAPQVVIPQFGESFLDRIVEMSKESDDLPYRQGLVEEIKGESLRVVPLEAEAAYYRSLIASLKGFESRARPPRPEELQQLRAQVDAVVNEAILTTQQVNEIYQIISKNLNPSTALYSSTQPASSRIERNVAIRQLALLSLLVIFLSIPAILFACLIHYRVTHDEAREMVEASEATGQV